jgi:hypothetical protein
VEELDLEGPVPVSVQGEEAAFEGAVGPEERLPEAGRVPPLTVEEPAVETEQSH